MLVYVWYPLSFEKWSSLDAAFFWSRIQFIQIHADSSCAKKANVWVGDHSYCSFWLLFRASFLCWLVVDLIDVFIFELFDILSLELFGNFSVTSTISFCLFFLQSKSINKNSRRGNNKNTRRGKLAMTGNLSRSSKICSTCFRFPWFFFRCMQRSHPFCTRTGDKHGEEVFYSCRVNSWLAHCNVSFWWFVWHWRITEPWLWRHSSWSEFLQVGWLTLVELYPKNEEKNVVEKKQLTEHFEKKQKM